MLNNEFMIVTAAKKTTTNLQLLLSLCIKKKEKQNVRTTHEQISSKNSPHDTF